MVIFTVQPVKPLGSLFAVFGQGGLVFDVAGLDRGLVKTVL